MQLFRSPPKQVETGWNSWKQIPQAEKKALNFHQTFSPPKTPKADLPSPRNLADLLRCSFGLHLCLYIFTWRVVMLLMLLKITWNKSRDWAAGMILSSKNERISWNLSLWILDCNDPCRFEFNSAAIGFADMFYFKNIEHLSPGFKSVCDQPQTPG